MTYFNTNREKDGQLAVSRMQASTQERKIYCHFLDHFEHRMSPEDVQVAVLPDAPLTSVRRALSVLTKLGVLVRTKHQVPGRYGKMVYTWRLRLLDDRWARELPDHG